MAYWLLKSEPDDWSWAEQVAKGRAGAEWTGIRSFAAQNHLRAMKTGERAFFYHTGKERAIVGIVKVIAEAHPDSTDSAWRAVDVAAVEPLPTPVGLDRIKADKRLAAWPWPGCRACRSDSHGRRVARGWEASADRARRPPAACIAPHDTAGPRRSALLDQCCGQTFSDDRPRQISAASLERV